MNESKQNELEVAVTDLGQYIKDNYPNDVTLFKMAQLVNLLSASIVLTS